MLDRSFIGHRLPDRQVDVEAGQLRFFAKATGETNPIYFDAEAARAAGHPALPAPPTFLFSLDLMADEVPGTLAILKVDMRRVLHGEQAFTSGAQIYAGDRITLITAIVDIFDRKGGALEFIVQETTGQNQHGRRVGTSRSVTVVRNS